MKQLSELLKRSGASKPSNSDSVVKGIPKESTQLTEDTNSSPSKPSSSFIKDIPKGTTPMTEDANSKSLDYFCHLSSLT